MKRNTANTGMHKHQKIQTSKPSWMLMTTSQSKGYRRPAFSIYLTSFQTATYFLSSQRILHTFHSLSFLQRNIITLPSWINSNHPYRSSLSLYSIPSLNFLTFDLACLVGLCNPHSFEPPGATIRKCQGEGMGVRSCKPRMRWRLYERVLEDQNKTITADDVCPCPWRKITMMCTNAHRGSSTESLSLDIQCPCYRNLPIKEG